MTEQTITMINGIDTHELGDKAETFKNEPEMAKFRFSARNKWLGGGHNQTTVTSFYAMGQDIPHAEPFTLDADEPPLLAGTDLGANPVGHLLNALVSCLTSSMVYHAAVRGIHIEEIESFLEGDLDVRGFMALEPDVRKGYQNIRVTFRVKSDAPKETLEECARFSPVFDVVTNGTNVALEVETV